MQNNGLNCYNFLKIINCSHFVQVLNFNLHAAKDGHKECGSLQLRQSEPGVGSRAVFHWAKANRNIIANWMWGPCIDWSPVLDSGNTLFRTGLNQGKIGRTFRRGQTTSLTSITMHHRPASLDNLKRLFHLVEHTVQWDILWVKQSNL